jgi:hypothetical protein
MTPVRIGALVVLCVALALAIGIVMAAASTQRHGGRPTNGGGQCTGAADCANHGACTGGKCVCKAGFTGPNCRELTCRERRCANGSGCLCATGQCVCDAGFVPDPATGFCVAGHACQTDHDCAAVPGYPKCSTISHTCVAGGTPPPPSPHDHCTKTSDCAHVAGKPKCDTQSHTCVACLVTADCPHGQTCGTDHTCAGPAQQCSRNTDCAHVAGMAVCDTSDHKCVECLTAHDCTGGKTCSADHKCTSGGGASPAVSAADFITALGTQPTATKLSNSVTNLMAVQAKAGTVKAANVVLAQYASVEFDMSAWPAQQTENSPTAPISNTIDPWFRATLAKCGTGDVLLINADFISMDGSVASLIAGAITRGMSFVFVLDRWEVGGNPIYASRDDLSTTCPSANDVKNQGSPGGCAVTWPYPCGTVSQEYCGGSNGAITGIMGGLQGDAKNRFFILDEATVAKPNKTSSRQSPWHDHRHVTTFYMPSQKTASIFKGSWNFTSGAGSDSQHGTLGTGQKEAGVIFTAPLASDVVQADIMQNYYWLTAMNTFAPLSGGTTLYPGPTAFLKPGAKAAPIFSTLLSMVPAKNQDKPNDLFKFPAYGAIKYDMYALVLDSLTGKLMCASDPAVTLSLGLSPPPAGAGPHGVVAAPSPTPWESGPSTMLNREIQDYGTKEKFSAVWPTLSCVSNTMQFLYPYTGVYKTPNVAPPVRFRVEKGKQAAGCPAPAASGAAIAWEGADAVSLDDNSAWSWTDESAVTAPVAPTCTSLPASGDVSSICLTAGPHFLPNTGCYTDGGKSYECSAGVPWAPGAFWLGAILYKFYKGAAAADDKRIYVSMYSDFADAPSACLLNCSNPDEGKLAPGYTNSGGLSAVGYNPDANPPETPFGRPTSTQYTGKAEGINGSGWFNKTDINCVADVLGFLGNSGVAVYAMAGQWDLPGESYTGQTIPSPNGSPYFKAFYDAAQTSHSTFQYKYYQAQTAQTTSSSADIKSVARRNHSKAYISKTSFVMASGHPYNGSWNDFSGINEVILAEGSPNMSAALGRNFENEFKYAETMASYAKVKSGSFSGAPAGFLNPTPLPVVALPPVAGWKTSSAGGGFGLVS